MAPLRRSARTAAAAAAKAAEEAAQAAAEAAKAAQKAKLAAKKAQATKPIKKKKKSTVAVIQKTSTKKKKKRSNTHGGPKSPVPTKKTKLSGLTTAVYETDAPLGVIDPEADIAEPENATIVSYDGEPCDVMLVLVDPEQNMDKFFILQWIELLKGKKKKKEYVVYTRWGRTGTVGQALQQDFGDRQKAQACFEAKFKQKTGLTWHTRTEPTVGNKYRYISQDFVKKGQGYADVQWQYWVDDGVDGKSNGWYDFDAAGCVRAERLYAEYQQNGEDFSNRWVQSGDWVYDLNLQDMTQTNVQHEAHKCRRIRRCAADGDDGDESPSESSDEEESESDDDEKKPAAPTTPARKTKKSAVVTPSKASSSSEDDEKEHKKKKRPRRGRPPVDPDVSLHHRDASDFQVEVLPDGQHYFDVVLNQCNIYGGNNNNKYYRIQLLREVTDNDDDDDDDATYFVWNKWGRVGEAPRSTASALKGPFDTLAVATREYAKKFRDKTGNDYDQTDNFQAVAGKYTLIEIDNEQAAVAAAANVEYQESKLETKTKELMEVLFSDQVRDEALANFNLDPERMPLGVPSQTQIQQGLDLLEQIQTILDSGSKDDKKSELEELTSQFYTAIPHSFGRSRPPVIRTQKALQRRLDMCDVLLDMHGTNETRRALVLQDSQHADALVQDGDDDDKKPNAALLPHPADRQYDSLKVDLVLLSQTEGVGKRIVEYFETTKHAESDSKVVDIWSIDRQGEAERYQKRCDKLDNRRLLWHGTNMAVVAPILTHGLRIMPHAGGRVGAGIYLTPLQEKAEAFTTGQQAAQNEGEEGEAKFACMFLAEAALGKMHEVRSEAPTLKQPPEGFDSVHAVGECTPASWGEVTLDDNKTVALPSAKPEPQDGVQSVFYHDEFLCYDEAQVRLRYLLRVQLDD